MVTTGLEVVGREEELAALAGFLDGTPAPRVLLLEGEAGIGKTTLWRAGVALGEQRGLRTLTCSPAEAETQLPFAATGDLLGALAASVLVALPPPQRRALAAALLLEDVEGPPPEPRAVAVAFLGVLRLLSLADGILVAVDDVQWLDGPSALLLEFALRRVRDEPIGFLLARRSRPGGRPPLGLGRALSGRVQRLEVGPLTLGALHRLLRVRLGTALPRPLLRRLHAASGGNPFYALELGRTLKERGAELEPGGPLPVPKTLHEVVRERIAAQPADVREALLVVASAATPTLAIVQAAGGSLASLEPAVEAGVIEFEGERIRFTHPLLASGVYSAALLHRRRTLHGRLAAIVPDAEERARHAALAAVGPDEEVARTLEEAARVAAARGAPDTAAELAEHAVQLTPGDQAAARWRRGSQAAGYHTTAGAYGRARTILENLAIELPAGRDRADVLHRMARTGQQADLEEYERMLERALLAAGSDGALVADINRDLSMSSLVRGSLTEARRFAQTAYEAAERLGDRTRVAATLVGLGLTELWVTGDVDQEVVKRVLALEAEVGHLRSYSHPRMFLGLRAMYRDQLSVARAYLTAGYETAAEEGDAFACSSYVMHLAELECRAGRWREAGLHAEECLELFEQISLKEATSGALYVKALVDARLGHVEQARATAERGLALSEEKKHWIFTLLNQSVLGFLELSLGDAPAAARRLASVHDPLGELSNSGILPNAIEAFVAVGELGEARPLLERLEERGETLDRAWALATGARCRGLLAAAEGDDPSAFAAFKRALAEHERLPDPFERGRTLLALGQTQRRANQKRAARESLEQALAVFEELGASLWVEKARVELGRIGGRRVPSRGKLSTTEGAIAELVAAGRTNDEVAAALSLSPRTVQWNLSKIYRKVGVRSRTELAAALAGLEQTRES